MKQIRSVRHRNRCEGFSLVELLIVVGIMAILATLAIPQFTESRKQNNLKSTFAELESVIKTARNSALTGFGNGIDTLPDIGYGVYVSNVTGYEDTAISFNPEDPSFDFPPDSSIITSILEYNNNITTYAVYHYNGTVCLEKDQAVIIFQPPRADALIKIATAILPAVDTETLYIVLTIDGSTDPARQRILEISTATGKIQADPDTFPC